MQSDSLLDHQATDIFKNKETRFKILKWITDKKMHEIYHVWLNKNFRDMIYDPIKQLFRL